ncbi:carbohydrate ABC transporter permease [candidate division Kazan bacterium]|uniref:Carbohydrate ABC transporter permease n=1 Tax=candidate division Kazan bacterium TaxID=2202143 RepID=A0A420ZAX4_UNCK3|nr:MAG: carbohydrate ABC transporter permease [candidate division Kazan bacterium]
MVESLLLYKLKKYLRVAVLVFLILAYLSPLYWIFTTAFKTRSEMFSNPFYLTQVTLENFEEAARYGAFDAIKNSVIITVGGVGLALLLSVFAAYAFSRYAIRGKNILMFYILSTRMMPPIALVIPIFVMFQKLGLKGTYTGLILMYATVSLPFSIWMIKSFIDDIPKDIDQAAILDGHSLTYVLFKIVIPMVLPGIVASMVFSAITIWNEFVFALLLSSIDTRPTSVLLSSIRGERGFNWGRIAAIEVVYILPIIIFVFLVQKHLLRGLTFGTVRR